MSEKRCPNCCRFMRSNLRLRLWICRNVNCQQEMPMATDEVMRRLELLQP